MKENWTYRKLGEACVLTMGQSPASESYNEEGKGLPFFQGCSDFGKLNPTVKTFCDAPTKIAEIGDVLMSVRAPIGTLNIANVKCCIGRGLASFRALSNSVNMYLYYFLIHSNNSLQKLGTGSTFKAIGKESLYNFPIPLPSLETQQNIVSELDLLQSIIDKQNVQLKELDNLAQSIFYDMFGDPVENEKGWKEKMLEEICLNIVDCPHSTPKKADRITNYPCIRTSELKGGNIFWDSMQYLEKDEYMIRTARLRPVAGDIVFGREGVIGDAVILPAGYCFSLGQRTMLLRTNPSIVSNVFLHRVILSEWVKKQIRMANVSSTVAHLNIKDFKKFVFPIPPLSLQQSFAAKIESIEKQKAAISKSIKETQKLFDYTMDKYFG